MVDPLAFGSLEPYLWQIPRRVSNLGNGSRKGPYHDFLNMRIIHSANLSPKTFGAQERGH